MTRFDDAFGPLAVATRSGFEESLFHGAAVALAADGSIDRLGRRPRRRRSIPRSSLKPLQATAMVGTAVSCSRTTCWRSCAPATTGAAMHTDAVLRRARHVRARRIGPAQHAVVPVRRRRPGPTSCARGQAPTAIAPELLGQARRHARHVPDQRLVDSTTTSHVGASAAGGDHRVDRGARCRPSHHVGVDGCGAPTHVIGLVDLARAFADDRHGRSPTSPRR